MKLSYKPSNQALYNALPLGIWTIFNIVIWFRGNIMGDGALLVALLTSVSCANWLNIHYFRKHNPYVSINSNHLTLYETWLFQRTEKVMVWTEISNVEYKERIIYLIKRNGYKIKIDLTLLKAEDSDQFKSLIRTYSKR